MKAEIKRRWIERLEAGPRKARRELRNKAGGRCCLGHLCDIAINDGVIGPWRKDSDFGWLCEGVVSHLPGAVQQWAGLSIEDQIPLIHANDDNPGYPLDLIRALPEE